MPSPHLLRVAALVDLPRSPQSGGHVKCWERLAAAAANGPLPLDLTVYFSGEETTEILSPKARIRQLPPVFSTARLKFLPYMPDTTDLSPWHPRLVRELNQYDVIHTTDGFFAFAQTAERFCRNRKIPLVTSFHTDTPAYTRIFTRELIEKLFPRVPGMRSLLLDKWRIPERQAKDMQDKLKNHVKQCQYALVTRDEDHALAENILGKAHVHHLRLGVDRVMFGPHKENRAAIEQKYGIPPNKVVVLFVGRVDIGKNIYTLTDAVKQAIAEGLPLHLMVAGKGPAMNDVEQALGDNASLPGYVSPEDLAQLYASSDVMALASEVEIRSMSGVEAMVSGCPSLISQKSGVWELFNHTPAMQVVDSGVDNWAAALRDFASTPDKKKLMHEAALEYSRDHLASWEDVLAEDLFDVWKEAPAFKKRRAA